MDNLRLSVPATHNTFLTSHGDIHCPAISGSLQIPPNPSLGSTPTVNVSLIRVITSGNWNSSGHGTGKRSYLRRIAKPVSIRPSSKSNECTGAETVVQCNLHYPLNVQQDGEGTAPLQFTLPIPNNIPGTTDTALGSISYTIRATATWSSGTVLDVTQPISIIPKMILSHCEPTECCRSYRNARMTTKLRLMPTPAPDPMAHIGYSARLVAHPTTTPGPRKMEMRYIVIKEVKWQIQETVKVIAVSRGVNSQEDAVTCKEQHVRQLCGGGLEGCWQASKEFENPDDRDDRVDISFNISLPKHAKAISGVQLSSYGPDSRQSPAGQDGDPPKIMITVDHQLKIDLITGEDTFDLGTRKLVDRKPLFKSFSAFFPIPIHELDTGEHPPEGIFNIHDLLPRYDDTSLMPPRYEATA